MLKALLAKDDDDKYDTGAILSFFSALEQELEGKRDVRNLAWREALETVYRARGYVSDRGALVKTLLESIALLSPRM